MSVDNYRLLIRNLRKNEHEKLAVQTIGSSVRYNKIRESVRVSEEVQSDNGKRQ